jgi:hypothetical protein
MTGAILPQPLHDFTSGATLHFTFRSSLSKADGKASLYKQRNKLSQFVEEARKACQTIEQEESEDQEVILRTLQ